eukprot:scaffold146859_cov46-Attheya_sp.AAC.1
MTASDLSNKAASTEEVKVNAEPVAAVKNVEAGETNKTKDETNNVESPSDKSSSTELTVETITEPSTTDADHKNKNDDTLKEDNVVDVMETSDDKQASTPSEKNKTTTSPKKRESPTAEPEGQPDAKKTTTTTPDDLKTISHSMEKETKQETSNHEEKKDEESSRHEDEAVTSSDQVAGESTKTATNKDSKAATATATAVDVEDLTSALPPAVPMVETKA